MSSKGSKSSAVKIYLQTTLFCNMKCRHCCYDSGPDRREFMSMDVFQAALRWEPQALLNVGGGEPTCHPLFWDFMAAAVRTRGRGRVWLATNGKLAWQAKLLASMVECGEIVGVLSQDEWHEPIRQDVVDAWADLRNAKGQPRIRNVGQGNVLPVAEGRCDWGVEVCNGWGGPWVMTDGTVRQCGCSDSPVIGNVFDGYESKDNFWLCGCNRGNPNRRRNARVRMSGDGRAA